MTDKEKIRAEIEREMGDITYGVGKPKGVYDFCKELLSFIDSLPEGPTPKGYDEAYLNECIAKASKTWEGVDVDKYMDKVRGRSPEESDDLEEAAEQFARLYDNGTCDGIAQDCFIAGAEWQKEQDQPITGNSLEKEWLRYVTRQRKNMEENCHR